MQLKLEEYYEAGVRLVWYIDPATKQVTGYTGVEQSTVLGETDTLTGGEVLPGFEIDLKAFFTLPEPPKEAAKQ